MGADPIITLVEYLVDIFLLISLFFIFVILTILADKLYLPFDDDNSMNYGCSHNHQNRMGQLITHRLICCINMIVKIDLVLDTDSTEYI